MNNRLNNIIFLKKKNKVNNEYKQKSPKDLMFTLILLTFFRLFICRFFFLLKILFHNIGKSSKKKRT
jgi:hypothetical protein